MHRILWSSRAVRGAVGGLLGRGALAASGVGGLAGRRTGPAAWVKALVSSSVVTSFGTRAQRRVGSANLPHPVTRGGNLAERVTVM
jgi:hypothetical protein